MLYYGLIYPLLSYGIVARGQSTKALTEEFSFFKKGQ
jgi:hypothetical protein